MSDGNDFTADENEREAREVPYPWTDEFPTAGYRGPDEFPVPGRWVLNIVEADGVMWYRYDDAENARDARHTRELDLSDDSRSAGPDAVAMLGMEYAKPPGTPLEEQDEYHELKISEYSGYGESENRLVTLYDAEFDSLGAREISQFIYPSETNELKDIEQREE